MIPSYVYYLVIILDIAACVFLYVAIRLLVFTRKPKRPKLRR